MLQVFSSPFFFPLPPLFRGAWFTIGPLGFPHQLSPCWNIPKARWSDWRRPAAWVILVGPAGPATSSTSSFPVAAFWGAILQASGLFAQHFPEKQSWWLAKGGERWELRYFTLQLLPFAWPWLNKLTMNAALPYIRVKARMKGDVHHSEQYGCCKLQGPAPSRAVPCRYPCPSHPLGTTAKPSWHSLSTVLKITRCL